MRTLSTPLTDEQQRDNAIPYVEVVLRTRDNVTTTTHKTTDATNRIVSVQQTEGRFGAGFAMPGSKFNIGAIVRIRDHDNSQWGTDHRGSRVDIGWGFEVNLIPNVGWESGDAGGWTLTSGGGFIGVNCDDPPTFNTHPRTGSCSLIQRHSNPTAQSSEATYEYSGFADLAGAEITFDVWRLWYDGGSGATEKFIEIDDGVGNTQTIIPGGGGWAKVSVTHTVDASPTRLRFRIRLNQTSIQFGRLSTDDMLVTVTAGPHVEKSNAEPGYVVNQRKVTEEGELEVEY